MTNLNIKVSPKRMLSNILIIILLAQDSISNWLNIELINYLDEILIFTTVVFTIFNIAKTKTISKASIILIAGIVSFSLVGIISCLLNSSSTFIDLIFSNFLAIKFWLLIISIMNLNFTKSSAEYFIDRILFAEKVVIIFAIFNFLFPEQYYYLFPGSDVSPRFGFLSICSIFDHPGKYGWFMLFCSIIHYAKLTKTKDKRELHKAIISAVLALFSFRTKVILSLAGCATIYLLFLNPTKTKKMLQNIIITATIALSLFTLFSDIIQNTYSLYFTTDQGESARQVLSQNGALIAKEYSPIGVGFGKYASWYSVKNYSEYYYKYNMDKVYGLSPDFPSYITDVFWPSILGETGFLGFTIYLYLLYNIFKLLLNIFRKDRKDTIVLIVILALTQTIFESFGEPSFNSSPQNLVLGTIIGLVFSFNIIKKGITK